MASRSLAAASSLDRPHSARWSRGRRCWSRRRAAARRPRRQRAPDPRVGLKAGWHDAGEAAKGMELVGSLRKPEGFDRSGRHGGLELRELRSRLPEGTLAAPGQLPRVDLLRHRGSGKRALRRSSCRAPAARATSRSRATCVHVRRRPRPHGLRRRRLPTPRRGAGTRAAGRGAAPAPDPMRFRGVRIFDISDLDHPKQIAAVQTCRGAHTQTLVDGSERQGQHLHLRVGHVRRAIAERAGRVLGPADRQGLQHVAVPHRRHQGAARRAAECAGRQLAAHLRRLRAGSPACGWAETTARARRRRESPTSATTSPCIPRSVSPPARARATAF